jgi:choline dehydrogenase-like flavoprotein
MLDLNKAPRDQVLQTEVCIVGGGVAGQSVMARLCAHKIDAVLLESGGHDFDAATQGLADGHNSGEPYYDLKDTRLRLFGGTAAIWGGRCAELDSIDFEKRDWVPHSGWPFSKQELDPYYDQVFTQLGLHRPEGQKDWHMLGRTPPPFDTDKLEAAFWAFDEKSERFTNPGRPDFTGGIIVLNANVTHIHLDDNKTVTSVQAQSLNHRNITVQAKIFVLAAGAIETTRLLMATVPNRPKGLGNDHDQLGRYFMEHPHARGGEIIPNNLAQGLNILPRAVRHKGHRYAAYLRPAGALQRKAGILNTSLSFAVRQRVGNKQETHQAVLEHLKHSLPAKKHWRILWHKGKSLAIRSFEKMDPGVSVLNMKMKRGRTGIFAVVRAEQAPNPLSRLTLGTQKDALGLPLIDLNWQMCALDRKSVDIMMGTLKDEFERLGLGTVKPETWLKDTSQNWKADMLISAHAYGGFHHMGGTRMSDNTTTGVVDSHTKLHDCHNMYIASSSVFPTGGWANPTVTIMAMALRLGDHLKQVIRP